MDKKRYRSLEQIFKGISNHRRIQIIDALDQTPELSVSDITEKLGINFRTASDHIKKLVISGTVMKRSDGISIRHALTKRGKEILKICKGLD